MIRRLALLLLVMIGVLWSQTLLTISKTPYESFWCSMDFTPVIGPDPFTLVGVLAMNVNTGANSTALVIASPGIVPGTDKVSFMVQGGTALDLHHISVRVNDTASGAFYEGQMNLQITQWP